MIDPEERGLLDTYSLDEEIGVVKTAVTVDDVVDDDVTITSAKSNELDDLQWHVVFIIKMVFCFSQNTFFLILTKE